MSFSTQSSNLYGKNKKKPPPRPPPPNFAKYKSISTLNLNQNQHIDNLIDWSPPISPTSTAEKKKHFGGSGSVSSSFSSSTSSLSSSKKSLEGDIPLPLALTNNLWPVNRNNYHLNNLSQKNGNSGTINSRAISSKPTIIRAQVTTKIPNGRKGAQPQIAVPPQPDLLLSPTLPMPSIPPPSPPKEPADEVPYGIALYDYPGTDHSDLSFQVDDVILLLRKINDEWLYGRLFDKEGMFPANYIDICVPLNEDNIVTALYHFPKQMQEDLEIRPGQTIKVLRKIDNAWLYGESQGQFGQFPANFVDKIPKNLL